MKEYFQKLFAYNQWANQEILKAVENAEKAQDEALPLLAHIITAQDLWLARILKAEHQNVNLWAEMSLEAVKSKLPESSEEWSEFVETMNEDHFQEEHQYTNSKGELFLTRLEDVILHVVNHGTHHRAQVSKILRDHGYNPPATDYIFFTRKQK